MGRLFGTDGVRGIANKELTPELAFRLGKAGAYVLRRHSDRPVFVIGRDTRVSGDMLQQALSAGILSIGGDVIDAGVMPTPGVAHLVKYLEADAGVVISASHNPYEYNGIKFFNGDGFKLDDAVEDAIEDYMENAMGHEAAVGKAMGRYHDGIENCEEEYIRFLLSTTELDLKGKKVVLDCANGAAYRVAPAVYKALGADVTVIGNSPDGININVKCGSTHPEALAREVLKQGAMVGLAFDGDADRLICVDEKGKVVDGDRTIAICAAARKAAGNLANDLVTATVMSNLGFHKYLESLGVDVDVTKVGDRYVLEKMLETGSVVGGEQSGHIIFLDLTTTGDGVLSSLQLMKAILTAGKPLSEMAEEITLYPQVLVNAAVDNDKKEAYLEDTVIQREIMKIEQEMDGEGRVLIRPSGTEPLVRVMIEGMDKAKILELATGLAEKLEKKFKTEE